MIQGFGSVTGPSAPPTTTSGGRSAVLAERQPAEGRKRSTQLSSADQQTIAKLQSRDREVRAHEAAHKSVGGSLAGSMSFSYESGPDGRRYAVGGEVSIDTGAERDPRATIAKMQRVIAAALAPAQPSSQDRAVAAGASAAMADAQRQLGEQQRAESNRAHSQAEDQGGARHSGQALPGYGKTSEPPGSLVDLIA